MPCRPFKNSRLPSCLVGRPQACGSFGSAVFGGRFPGPRNQDAFLGAPYDVSDSREPPNTPSVLGARQACVRIPPSLSATPQRRANPKNGRRRSRDRRQVLEGKGCWVGVTTKAGFGEGYKMKGAQPGGAGIRESRGSEFLENQGKPIGKPGDKGNSQENWGGHPKGSGLSPVSPKGKNTMYVETYPIPFRK